MISALGIAALIAVVALGVACTATWAVAGRAGARQDVARAIARRCTVALWLATAAAVGLMEWALLTGDFSVSYVAQTGSTALPLYYTVTALWSASGGSLLLWLLVLSTYAALFARRVPKGVDPASHAAAMAVIGVLLTGFALLTAVGAAPFDPVASPATDGPGPNPLLQDHPAMGMHPPLLYAGFAGLAVPFALSLGALLAGHIDAAWARAVRRWTLPAWIFLTAGIALGAWWAYAVLGWGGYWAWDPVENVSLMPWLLATALLHLLRTPRRDHRWGAAAASLAGAAFLLVLLGTMLTRSGAVISVHAFSESPLGPPLLALFGILLVAWVALLVARRDRLGPQHAGPHDAVPLLSRRNVMRAQALMLTLIAAIVLVGTVLPVVVQAVAGDRLSVGAPWFNRAIGPLALAVLALMALGPMIANEDDDPRVLARRCRWPAVAGLATVAGIGFLGPGGLTLPVVGGLAAFVVTTLAQHVLVMRRRRSWRRAWTGNHRRVGALVAHAGVALAAVAVVGTGHGMSEQRTVSIGDSVVAGEVSATVLEVRRDSDDRRATARAQVLLGEGRDSIDRVEPSLHLYAAHAMVVPSPAERSSLTRSVQVALLDVDPEAGTATIRLTVTPLLWWLWIASAVMVAGGMIAGLSTARLRPVRLSRAGTGENAPPPVRQRQVTP